MMMTMKPYFHFGFGDQFLFEQLRIDSNLKMWTTCTVLFILTLIFEAIKYVRCVRCGCQQPMRKSQATNGEHANDNGDLQDHNDTSNIRLAYQHNLNCYVGRFRSQRHRLIQTILHTAQTTLGFVIMLSVMSFNLCIIFAILVGKCQNATTFRMKKN